MRLKMYLWILCVSVGIVYVINLFTVGQRYSIFLISLISIVNPLVVIAVDGLIAKIIHDLPRKWFSPHYKIFQPFKCEKSFYRKMKINAWKDFIPDTGKQTTGLSKSEIAGTEADYLFRFLEETCYAEYVHYGMAIMGFPLIFLAPKELQLSLMLPHAFINFFLNIPPIFIQRNNRPKLLHMYERQLKKANKELA